MQNTFIFSKTEEQKTDRNIYSNFKLMVYHHNLMTTHDAITWLIYKF